MNRHPTGRLRKTPTGKKKTLWARTSKNTDWSNEPLARSLAPLTRLLAPHYSLCSRAPLRSLNRSLAPKLVGQLMIGWLFILCFLSILAHSVVGKFVRRWEIDPLNFNSFRHFSLVKNQKPWKSPPLRNVLYESFLVKHAFLLLFHYVRQTASKTKWRVYGSTQNQLEWPQLHSLHHGKSLNQSKSTFLNIFVSE